MAVKKKKEVFLQDKTSAANLDVISGFLRTGRLQSASGLQKDNFFGAAANRAKSGGTDPLVKGNIGLRSTEGANFLQSGSLGSVDKLSQVFENRRQAIRQRISLPGTSLFLSGR